MVSIKCKVSIVLFVCIMVTTTSAMKPQQIQESVSPDKTDMSEEKALVKAKLYMEHMGYTAGEYVDGDLVYSYAGLRREWHLHWSNAIVWLESEKGDLLSFVSLEEGDKALLSEKTRQHAISERVAKEVAAETVNGLGLKMDMKHADVRYKDTQDVKKGDLLGATWEVFRSVAAGGTECYDSFVMVSVRAADGKTIGFHRGYSPEDVHVEEVVSLVKAKGAVEKAFPGSVVESLGKDAALFVNPFLHMLEAEDAPLLAWIFRKRSLDDRKGSELVFVDASNGEVLSRKE